jgi:arylsulfatase A-like enzyme
LLDYLTERSDEEKRKPFFAYLPYSAPHWPLQAPKENVAKYRGMYADGPEALRLRRIQKLKDLGLVADNVKPHPIVAMPGEQEEWQLLDDDTRAKSARAMEVYAGMVDRMDWDIGRVVSYLRETGEYDNTMILFMSDNGAEGASYEAKPILGDKILPHLAKYYDNSLENIGRGTSFVWYGARWAQAATAPSRLFKMFSTEGGCRVPLIVKPPRMNSPTLANGNGVGSENRGKSQGPITTDAFCTVMDLVPTMLDMAGIEHPGSTYKGRQIAPLRGKSWLPFLDAMSSCQGFSREPIHAPDYAAGFEIAGSGAVRRGDFKITFVPAPRGPQRWELFNVREDPGETNDLKEKLPGLFNEMLGLWEQYKKEVGVVGLAGEFKHYLPGDKSAKVIDEFSDPIGWIKFIGRPEITPDRLKDVIPQNVR